ncbi:MAG: hypothetical protein LBM04_08260 [Opitutaceae bacterium]|jgi:hypothetical protein|nr:hypothetical protein [Opitutaceae bacterium]
MPFIASNLGGGTLAGKVAHQIDETRAAAERADAEDAVAPYVVQESLPPYGNATATDAGSFDDDGPSWPNEAAESAFLAHAQRSTATESDPAATSADNSADNGEQDASNLPPLDSLVARIPEETRKALEGLFGAKFKAVRKIPRKLIK